MSTFLLLPSPSCASLLSKESATVSNLASIHSHKPLVKGFRVRALREKTEEIKSPSSQTSSSAEEVTKKYGLEAGLWKIFSSKEEENGNSGEKSKGDQAKELLAKYGGAYLATSITLSLISFTLCYALINAGVDVQSLLQKVGISPNEAGEKVGTFALAYAAHKAASPISFLHSSPDPIVAIGSERS
uniref:DUF1279 domain-containing protein n=1 Tax=Lotus japonicus TaxID=34305 RepID=I3SVT5_LOTJA|nr:unknown [Lotus japonicus]